LTELELVVFCAVRIKLTELSWLHLVFKTWQQR